MATILCVDAQPSVGVVFEHTLTTIGHRPILVSSVDDALKTVARTSVDLIVADYAMPKVDGVDLLRMLENEGYRIPVIIMIAYSGIENAVSSIKSGAIDCLMKPIRAETLEIAVTRALEVIRLRQENEAFRSQINELRATAPIIPGAAGLPDVPVYNLEELERRAIERALEATGGNRTRAAKLLGISERTIRNKLNGPKAVGR
jgi:two-component system response regulator HydG